MYLHTLLCQVGRSCIDCQTWSHPCQYAEQICQVDHANASAAARQGHNKQAGPHFIKTSERKESTGTASPVDCPSLLSAISLPSARCIHALLSPLQRRGAGHVTGSGTCADASPWNSVGNVVHDLLPGPASCPERLAEVQHHHPGAMLLLVDGPGCRQHPQILN